MILILSIPNMLRDYKMYLQGFPEQLTKTWKKEKKKPNL